MRRLECPACHESIFERIQGRLYGKRCLRCRRGFLREPEECYPDEHGNIPALNRVTGDGPLIAKALRLSCWACQHSIEELKPGALLGSVCNRCGEGRLLACPA